MNFIRKFLIRKNLEKLSKFNISLDKPFSPCRDCKKYKHCVLPMKDDIK